jgi:hypothetical protein
MKSSFEGENMPPQFKNLSELNEYLGELEGKVQALEGENKKLRDYLANLGADAQKLLPKTNLFSPSFIQRAFAVWGHYFVAQLMITVPLLCIYFIVIFAFLQNNLKLLPTP